MPKNWGEDEHIKCPFYVKEKGVSMQCESPCNYEGVEARLLIVPNNKKARKKRYCYDDYKSCPIYKDCMKKYEK
ncbi:MAG: hypothetical protein E7591_00875 [Ruminococcaceae bacterium]|nr:hypothetical protein [Oscillospiraceae bacterium]